MFISAGTTVLTTLLIGARIYSISHISISRSKLYHRIMVTIVESAAVYSLILVLYGIVVVCPLFNIIDSPLIEAQYYIQQVLTVIAVCFSYRLSRINVRLTWLQGMTPTIMVARLALTSSSTTDSSATMTHVSAMYFDSASRDKSRSSATKTEGCPITPIDKDDDEEKALVVELRRSDGTEASIGRRSALVDM